MKCPKCKSSSLIKDSRYTQYGKWRREECRRCGHIFTAVEITGEEYEHLKKAEKTYKSFVKKLKSVEEHINALKECMQR